VEVQVAAAIRMLGLHSALVGGQKSKPTEPGPFVLGCNGMQNSPFPVPSQGKLDCSELAIPQVAQTYWKG
jgi:hypothetical protein